MQLYTKRIAHSSEKKMKKGRKNSMKSWEDGIRRRSKGGRKKKQRKERSETTRKRKGRSRRKLMKEKRK